MHRSYWIENLVDEVEGFLRFLREVLERYPKAFFSDGMLQSRELKASDCDNFAVSAVAGARLELRPFKQFNDMRLFTAEPFYLSLDNNVAVFEVIMGEIKRGE